MKYKLAKELDDAGFPFTYDMSIEEYGEVVPLHLDELIDACGEEFWKLMKTDDGTGEWLAFPSIRIIKNDGGTYIRGKTKLEAVAALWLSLNKK